MATSLKSIDGIKTHPSVFRIEKGHPMYIVDIAEWLDYNIKEAHKYARLVRRGHKELIAQRYIHEGYVKDIRHYLRSGDWISNFYGRDQEYQTIWRTIRA